MQIEDQSALESKSIEVIKEEVAGTTSATGRSLLSANNEISNKTMKARSCSVKSQDQHMESNRDQSSQPSRHDASPASSNQEASFTLGKRNAEEAKLLPVTDLQSNASLVQKRLPKMSLLNNADTQLSEQQPSSALLRAPFSIKEEATLSATTPLIKPRLVGSNFQTNHESLLSSLAPTNSSSQIFQLETKRQRMNSGQDDQVLMQILQMCTSCENLDTDECEQVIHKHQVSQRKLELVPKDLLSNESNSQE